VQGEGHGAEDGAKERQLLGLLQLYSGAYLGLRMQWTCWADVTFIASSRGSIFRTFLPAIFRLI
jgi:hypothetical protein